VRVEETGALTSSVKVRSPDRSFDAIVATPAGEGPWPGLVVIHEVFGVTPWVLEVAQRFAGEGYLTAAPDLFVGRLHPHFTPQAALRLMPLVWQMPVETRIVRKAFEAALSAQRTEDVDIAWALARLSQGFEGMGPMVGDLRATVQRLRSDSSCSGRVGCAGFCFGGKMAFHLACAEPSLGAAVVFYGGAPREEDMANIACPVLGLYGEDDEHITKDVPRAQAAMRRLGKPFETEVYNRTGHAFARPGSAHYREDRAKEAFARADAFLGKHLGNGPPPTPS
jgi:carboxymethylenebutenolidase